MSAPKASRRTVLFEGEGRVGMPLGLGSLYFGELTSPPNPLSKPFGEGELCLMPRLPKRPTSPIRLTLQ